MSLLRLAANTDEGNEDFELPESVRDLDLNREGYEEEVLKLPIHEFRQVLIRNDLKCRSEDQVLSLTIAYIERA